MSNLPYRIQIIKDKRMQTPRREFLREICSWKNMVLTRNRGLISRYPTDRMKTVVPFDAEIVPVEQSIDDTQGFFDQFKQLFYAQDHHALLMFYENENADFSDSSFGGKNIYLSYEVGNNASNICYSMLAYNDVHDVVGSSLVGLGSSVVFDSYLVEGSMRVFYSSLIFGSSDIWWSKNLKGCSECICCVDMENQSYCIFNKPYSKDEYMLQKKMLLQDYGKLRAHYDSMQSQNNTRTNNVTDSDAVFLSTNMHRSRNVLFGVGGVTSTDCYDGVSIGIDSTDIWATLATGTNSSNIYCCIEVGTSSMCFYSYFLESCAYCLGCIGLKNKSYCIFNKQYTKEERDREVDIIFSKMENAGALGAFFPGSINPYYFNDTIAYLADDSFTKEEIESQGYLWRQDEVKVDIPEGVEIVSVSQLDEYESIEEDGTITIDPMILKKVIQDSSGNYYRIVPMEYKFLKKRGLPLPRKHRLERMKQCFDVAK